ncbi:MAG: hypothetical protein KatS3mg085_037 [Candidatus Dojkabacteria bacterium]|nr:MAG: hypothetical protein KatS3mg085_037 [Candidatus Dojkabacteria bacterium]
MKKILLLTMIVAVFGALIFLREFMKIDGVNQEKYVYRDYEFEYDKGKYKVSIDEPQRAGPEVWGVKKGGIKIKNKEGGELYIVLLNKRFSSEYDEDGWKGMDEEYIYNVTVEQELAQLYEMEGNVFNKEKVYLFCGYVIINEYVCRVKTKEADGKYYEIDIEVLGYPASQVVMKFEREEDVEKYIESFLKILDDVLKARRIEG